MRPEQKPGPDELLAAAQFGNLGAVERLVDSGMDVNALSSVQQPLMMALGGDKHKIVLQMLLNGGSETSFHLACCDRPDCAKALVRAGCDTESGKTVREFVRVFKQQIEDKAKMVLAPADVSHLMDDQMGSHCPI